MEALDTIRAWTERQPIPSVVQWGTAILAVVVGLFLARVGTTLVVRVSRDRLDEQQVMIAQRVLYWTVLVLALATALRQVGFDLSVVMGAAGVLTVAIGFASQTSASNLISGLFLVMERPFVVGDTIQVGATIGQVVAIDPLSVKLRTFDNRLVRVPNESLLKSEIANLTHYAIRRVDLSVRLGFGADVARARAALLKAADAVQFVLDEPRPTVTFDRFDDAGVRLQFSAWCTQETVAEAKDALAEAVLATLRREGIGLLASAPAPAAPVPQTPAPDALPPR